MCTRKLRPTTALLAAIIGTMMVPSAALADATSLFKELAGSWHGSGDLVLEDGTREKLSCRGYYVLKSGGDGLSIATLCESPSQKLEIRSLVSENASGISGQWEERTYHATGPISGSANGMAMDLSFSGPIEGTISILHKGKTHSVNVSAPGAEVKGVSISFTRS